MFRSVRLAALVAVAVALAASASAQQPLPAHAGVHVLTVGPDGALACDVAAEAQVGGLHDASARTAGQSVRLTALPSLNPAGLSDFRIVLRATDQLLERPAALLAFRRAAARWERVIQSDVSTVIDVDYGPERFGTPYPSNVLGSTNSALYFAGTTSGAEDMVQRLRATTDDAQLLALYDAIPTPTPSTLDGPLNRGIGGLIPLQVLEYAGSFGIPVPTEASPFGDVPSIGFNDAFPYDFDPTDGIESNQTDFEGVALHEIGHALGFTSAVGFEIEDADPVFAPWDLFRVRPDAVEPGESLTDGAGFETAVRVITPGPPNTEVLVVENGTTYYSPVQVFFDGDTEYEVSTATGAREGGDGQQASHWRDDRLRPPALGDERKIGIMDPNIGRGEFDQLTYADIRVLDVIGYDVVYDPPTATVALSIAGQAIDDRFLVTDSLALGDVDTGDPTSIPLVIGNEDADAPLDFRIETELTSVFPTSLSPALDPSVSSGTIAPDGSTAIDLQIGGVPSAAIVEGLVRIISNDDQRSVIEVPVAYTVGGARAPELATGDIPDSLGDLSDDEMRTVTLPISNAGSFDLSYRVITGFSTRAFEFPDTTPPGTELRGAAPVFTADFESDTPLAGFQYSQKAAPDRWQVRTEGPAALPGHSTPAAAYYGKLNGVEQYSDNTLGQLRTPAIDLSGVSPDSRVTLSFAHYLQAEAGFDFATVLASFDGGASYEEIATSNGGVLRNTEGAWETVTLEIPGAAGFPTPLYFAFRFDSDAGVTDVGWYLDDIVVDAEAGQTPLFVTPVAGTIPGDGNIELTLTADASILDPGFYRGSLELVTDQPDGDPAPFTFTFTVGDPAFPTVVALDANPMVAVENATVAEVTFDFRNGGDGTLSFVRVLEPAISRFEGGARHDLAGASLGAAPDASAGPVERAPARTAPGEARKARDDGDVLADVAISGRPDLFDLAQLADGRVVVFDGARPTRTTAYVFDRELAGFPDTYRSGPLSGSVTGAAYNPQTGSLWIALFESTQLVEVTLDGADVVPTDRTVDLDFTPFGMDYSPALGAFLIGSYETAGLFAVTVDGEVLPGYPSIIAGRGEDDATSLPGVSFYEGLLESTGTADELLARDQFGARFGGTGLDFSDAVLAGSEGVYGLLRDRLDPDGSFYVTTRYGDSAEARIVRIDPPDLPENVGTVLDAAEPIFADRSIAPQETFDVVVSVDGQELATGERTDELAFLTNNPSSPVVRVPITVTVSAVAAEDGVVSAFGFAGVHPNPANGRARVSFALPEAAAVTVGVYDALGRRVAVLADGTPLAAGANDLWFPTATLAPGVYVVRVAAGTESATQTVTVVR